MDKKNLGYTDAQVRKSKELIKKECANLSEYEYCLYYGLNCIMLLKGVFYICPYFENSVLPLDQELETSIKTGVDMDEKVIYKNCQDCGTSFIASSKNTLYCDKCRRLHRKETKRKYSSKKD